MCLVGFFLVTLCRIIPATHWSFSFLFIYHSITACKTVLDFWGRVKFLVSVSTWIDRSSSYYFRMSLQIDEKSNLENSLLC